MTSYLAKFGYFVSSVTRLKAGCEGRMSYNSKMTWCQLRYLASESSRDSDSDRKLIRLDYFDTAGDRTKDTYLEMVNIYKEKERLRRGHVEFIYSAMRHMKEFGVEKDLEVYKSLIDIFPKGKMIPKNIFQVEFMHYPKHQQCAIDLLEQMEENGVIPDWDMEDQLVNVFGNRGYPVRRYWRMMYWMPKWRNASPFPLPRPLPSDSLQLAQLAIERITKVDINTEISVFKTDAVEDSVDDTWIVSGQSDDQRNLIENLEGSATLYIEGEYRIWLKNAPISYFVLSTDPRPVTDEEDSMGDAEKIVIPGMWRPPSEVMKVKRRSVHEQEDCSILAVCATGTSSRDSLLSWIRCLQPTNPRLSTLPVLFRLSGRARGDSDEQVTRALEPPTPAITSQ